MLTGWIAAAHAAQPLAPIMACRGVQDPTARLACFDREAANLADATRSPARAPSVVATPVPAPVAPPTAPAPAAPPSAAKLKDNFGLSQDVIEKKEETAGNRPVQLNKLDAHIVSVSSSGTGLTTFTLDNGQVWRQLAPEGDLLVRSGDTVTLSRGVFHSYWLQAPTGRGCKVTRVL